MKRKCGGLLIIDNTKMYNPAMRHCHEPGSFRALYDPAEDEMLDRVEQKIKKLI